MPVGPGAPSWRTRPWCSPELRTADPADCWTAPRTQVRWSCCPSSRTKRSDSRRRRRAVRSGPCFAPRHGTERARHPTEAAELVAVMGWPLAQVALELLTEWDYGDYEGITTAQIAERRGSAWNMWADGAPGGETAADVGRRVDRVLARVAPVLDAGKDACLIAHGHSLRVTAARWLGLEP